MLALPRMKPRGESGYIPGAWTSDRAERPPRNTSHCPLVAALRLDSNRNRYLEAPNKADLSGKAVGRWRLGSSGMSGWDTGGRNLEGTLLQKGRSCSQVFASDRSTASLHVCNYTLVRNGTPVPMRRFGRISTLQGAALLHLPSKKIQYPISHMT